MSLMPDTIQNDLELARHGYRSVPVGPYFVPFPDGRCIVQADDDAQSNYDEFAKFSKRDADAIEQWDAWIGGLAAVLGPLLMTTPPRVGSMSVGDLQEQLKLVWRFRGLKVRGIADVTRLMTMSIMDILDRFFETRPGEDRDGAERPDRDVGRPARAGDRLRDGAPLDRGGRRRAPRRMGDARSAAWARSRRRSRRARGASAPRSDARRRSSGSSPPAAGSGASSSRDGTELTAPVVVAATHPQITFLRQLDAADLPADFVDDIRNWRSRSGTVKINLALDRAPEFTAKPDQEDFTGGMELAHSIDVPRDRVRGGARRACRDRAVLRRRDARPITTRRSRPRASTSCRCSRSGCRTRSGPTSPTTRRSRRTPTASIAGYDELAPGLRRLGPAPAGDRSPRDAGRVGPDRREHLPRRAVGRAAVPHAPRARLRGLPHADPRPVPVLERDARAAAASPGSPRTTACARS